MASMNPANLQQSGQYQQGDTQHILTSMQQVEALVSEQDQTKTSNVQQLQSSHKPIIRYGQPIALSTHLENLCLFTILLMFKIQQLRNNKIHNF